MSLFHGSISAQLMALMMVGSILSVILHEICQINMELFLMAVCLLCLQHVNVN